MHWFFIAIISPILLSIVHHSDKYLLSKISKESTIGSVILFSTLFPVLILPIIALTNKNLLQHFSYESSFLLISAGIMSSLALLLYFHALEEEETSMVAPMFQLMPVFGYILGLIVLNESLALDRILAAIVIILGATMLSFEIEDTGEMRFKTRPMLLMVGASLLLTMNDVIFKKVAINSSYSASLFWNFVGYGIFAAFILLFVKKFRSSFVKTIKEKGRAVFSINIFNEILQTIATATFSYAILLAPIALVLLTEAYQPIFVFIIGIILTKYFPRIATEKTSRKHLIHKATAIAIVVIGSIFVYS